MKNLIIALSLLIYLTGTQTLAQEKDTTRIKFGKKEIIIIERNGEKTEVKIKTPGGETDLDSLEFLKKEVPDSIDLQIDEDDEDSECEDDDNSKFKGHWSGFDVGINNYVDRDMKIMGSQNAMNLDAGKSWYVALNLLQYDLAIVPENLGLVTGIGLDWNNYRFSGPMVLGKDPETGATAMQVQDFAVADADGLDFTRNKLGTWYLTVPLLLEFQAPVNQKGRKIFFNAGLTGGIKLSSWTHQEWETGKTEYERHSREDLNISPFRYGVQARVGFGKLQLFANYQLNSLFEKDMGPELYPFSAGLQIIRF